MNVGLVDMSRVNKIITSLEMIQRGTAYDVRRDFVFICDVIHIARLPHCFA